MSLLIPKQSMPRISQTLSAHRLFIKVLALGICCGAVVGQACTSPVFRYALERWIADPYFLIVAHNEPLDAEQQAWVAQLRENSAMHTYALKGVEGKIKLPFAPPIEFASDAAPMLFLFAPPEMGLDRPVWSGAFHSDNIGRLLKSPTRDKLFQRLMGGHSAVWLVVLPAKDNTAFLERMEALLQKANQMFGAPAAKSAAVAPNPPTMYPIHFSMLAMDRDTEQEVILLSFLKALAPEIYDTGEPLALAVFGRGRALQPMTASSLTGDAVREICAFLTGFCSCQIKEMNPGVDLFMPMNWEAALNQQTEEP